jgi:hypothetical protein
MIILIPKILFWIEGATIHFGIAKFLQDKLNCDLYGIIDVNSEKEFFEEQKIVNFKKIWFYRDEIIRRNSIEPEYLKKTEEEYKIDLLKVVYSDVWLHKYNNYYKYSFEEIKKILENDCMFFERVLDEIKPDYLVIRMSDASHMELLQMLCKAKGVKILTLGPSRLGHRSLISEHIDRFDKNDSMKSSKDYTFGEGWPSDDVLKLMEGSVAKSIPMDHEVFVKTYDFLFTSKQESEERKKFKANKMGWVNGVIHFSSLILNPEYSKYYRHFGMNLFSVIKNEMETAWKRKCGEKFIDKNLRKNIPEGKFIYFPLHLEPERTTRIAAPFFANQLEIIRNIAKSIPIDHEVFVKEHPMQKLKDWRKISWYKEIIEMPNVELFHPSVSSHEMIKKSSLVMSINGTSAMEAAFYKKPSILFADTIFSELPSVLKVNSWEELPDLIRKALTTEINFSDINKFLNKLVNSSFDMDELKLELKFLDRFYYGGYLLDSKISEEDARSFLEENKDQLSILADAHLQKIS